MGIELRSQCPTPEASQGIGRQHHTEACVLISTCYGGLEGTGYGIKLRKIGEQWVVVWMEMEYIS